MWLCSGNAQPHCWLLAMGHVFVLPLHSQPRGKSMLSAQLC